MEKKLPTGGGRAPQAGPPGSDAWKSAIEFKLGIRGRPDVPARGSAAWCRHIDHIARTKGGNPGRAAKGPSFSCRKVKAGGTEAMICGDAELSALDRKLSGVYAAAARKAVDENPPMLKAEQRGWIKGRNACWRAADERACIKTEYRRRIAELQAGFALVSGTGPVRYACEGKPSYEVVATFFATDPPTLIAERADRVSLMYLQPAASGTRYLGRNESFWEHQGQALISWGHKAPEMRCRRVP
jgi:uncharacterized protein